MIIQSIYDDPEDKNLPKPEVMGLEVPNLTQSPFVSDICKTILWRLYKVDYSPSDCRKSVFYWPTAVFSRSSCLKVNTCQPNGQSSKKSWAHGVHHFCFVKKTQSKSLNSTRCWDNGNIIVYRFKMSCDLTLVKGLHILTFSVKWWKVKREKPDGKLWRRCQPEVKQNVWSS